MLILAADGWAKLIKMRYDLALQCMARSCLSDTRTLDIQILQIHVQGLRTKNEMQHSPTNWSALAEMTPWTVLSSVNGSGTETMREKAAFFDGLLTGCAKIAQPCPTLAHVLDSTLYQSTHERTSF